VGEKVIAKFKDWTPGGGLAIVACTKEVGNYHIVARSNSQFPKFGLDFMQVAIKR
jgi:hypothetical protein